MAEHELEVNGLLPLDYFESHRLNGEEINLEKQGFIEIIKKNGEKGYYITNTGKKVLSELDEYYEIISVENLSI